jgi:NAD(P)H-quinone oxidoreductase subunit 5
MTSILAVSAAIGPAALAAAAILPPAAAAPRRIAAFATAAAFASFALAVASAAGTAVFGPSHADILTVRGGGLSFHIDALAATMYALVAFVGLVVIRYSRNYLDGDPRHGYFLRRLCLTIAAVQLLVISGNLVQLATAWIATSLALNALLLLYGERPAARLAARKKFVVSRVGDACLIAATLLLFVRFGSFDIPAIVAEAKLQGEAGVAVAAAILIATAALLKSAQFPSHGWILEVMETPTPVSALLHAGIVNAGGFLVLRLADVVAASPEALHLLAVVGATTALFGSLVTMTQTSVKVSLAYSTIAQMGFMLMQCGLGAFSAALLHIVAHSLYKAHAFLSSGGVIDLLRASWSPSPGGRPHPARLAIAIAAVLGIALGAAALFDALPADKPGIFALGAILLLGLTMLVANAIDERPSPILTAGAVAAAAIVAGIYFALQRGAEFLLRDAVPPTLAMRSPVDVAIVASVVAAFAFVAILQSEIGRPTASPRWHAMYVHLANGLYVNTLANRAALRFWPRRFKSTNGAAQ